MNSLFVKRIFKNHRIRIVLLLLMGSLFPMNAVATSKESASASKSLFGANCKVEKSSIASVQISDAPDWLFIPFPNGRFLAYSSADDLNFLFDRSNLERIAIPGSSDFVVSPDTSIEMKLGFASVPHEPMEAGNPVISKEQAKKHYLSFLDIQSVFQCQPTEIFRDYEMLGNYQTIGLLSSRGSKRTYRVIAAREGLKFRDYELDYATTPAKMRALVKPRPLCPNQQLRLPKISPDGSELAAFDISDQKSKIFRILKNGTCELRESLQTTSGKIDFSPSGRYLTYHRIRSSDSSKACGSKNNTRSLPSLHANATPFVYDRRTNRERKLDIPKCSSSIYPRFLRNEEIALQILNLDRRFPTIYKNIEKTEWLQILERKK